MRDLAVLYTLLQEPSLLDGALRIAWRLEREAAALERATLESGAMPGEFRVVHVFKRGPGADLTTRLA